MSVFKFINILKVANFGLISVSYGLSRIFHSNIYAGVPYFISFEISSICNLNCSQCERGAGSINRKNKFFDFNLYKNILKVNGKYMINTILYFHTHNRHACKTEFSCVSCLPLCSNNCPL